MLLMESSSPVCCGAVVAGSSLRRLQPRELKDSRSDWEAMLGQASRSESDRKRARQSRSARFVVGGWMDWSKGGD
jgi:hypothetical protein